MRLLYRKLKLLFRMLTGKEPWYTQQVHASMKWYGEQGAGFFVCEDKLSASSIVYSFGIGENISFDSDLIKKYGLTIYGFDPTPKSIQFIHNQPKQSHFIFCPYGLATIDGHVTFYLPENTNNVSGTFYNRWKYDENIIKPIDVPVKKFSSILKEFNHYKIDILKMDIEGAEYEVIDDILHSNVVIDQILVELHHRFSGISVKKTKEFVEKMNAFGYKISKISESREEYSFLKIE